ncbi:hypothetical protein FIU94_03475 [Sulfitobacter sp. THAF37]|uniref:hypothetical protein n=1 Tax=Sulfitobacter sp. THAF37 TaxID=2587855 RepID=UPI001268D92D|nr:hypothetical protein [Sulfitobacter sp. THAF37]QFT57875.1 hypothetical protein FIU94_03475 [Sulfitobacter sp. THAF37]
MPTMKHDRWYHSTSAEVPQLQAVSQLRSAMLDIGSLLLIFIATPLALFYDTSVAGQPMSESTLTERLQVVLIVISMLAFATGAFFRMGHAGYTGAVTTLLACMAIRENDSAFDLVYHGFWLVPALAALAVGGAYTWSHRAGAWAAFAAHLNTRPGTYFILGLLLLLVFSRLFGTGAVWEGVMGAAYTPEVKAAVQEGLELLGYFLLSYGAFLSLQNRFGGEPNDVPR